jgi:hypothetical protein
MILGGIVLYYLNPTQYWFMPKCPFKMITGLSCPGCGIQRAIHALVHGEFAEAIRYNYFLAYSGPYAALFVIEWMMPQNKTREKLSHIIENKHVVYFYVLSFSIWLVVRNLLNI